MGNKVKDIDMKSRKSYFLNDIINIRNFDSYNTKIDEKSQKNILVYYIVYVTINKVNEYFEETDRNKYLTLVPFNESKKKKNEELLS